MSAQSPSQSSNSELVSAIMLATLLAVTGLETALIVAAPHKATAHPLGFLAAGHFSTHHAG